MAICLTSPTIKTAGTRSRLHYTYARVLEIDGADGFVYTVRYYNSGINITYDILVT